MPETNVCVHAENMKLDDMESKLAAVSILLSWRSENLYELDVNHLHLKVYEPACNVCHVVPFRSRVTRSVSCRFALRGVHSICCARCTYTEHVTQHNDPSGRSPTKDRCSRLGGACPGKRELKEM
eukprot:6464941-Amphidinium_carterae.1